jgi:hypothetical protein
LGWPGETTEHLHPEIHLRCPRYVRFFTPIATEAEAAALI